MCTPNEELFGLEPTDRECAACTKIYNDEGHLFRLICQECRDTFAAWREGTKELTELQKEYHDNWFDPSTGRLE